MGNCFGQCRRQTDEPHQQGYKDYSHRPDLLPSPNHNLYGQSHTQQRSYLRRPNEPVSDTPVTEQTPSGFQQYRQTSYATATYQPKRAGTCPNQAVVANATKETAKHHQSRPCTKIDSTSNAYAYAHSTRQANINQAGRYGTFVPDGNTSTYTNIPRHGSAHDSAGKKSTRAGLSLSGADVKKKPLISPIDYNKLSDCDLVVFACKILDNFMVKYLEVETTAKTLGAKLKILQHGGKRNKLTIDKLKYINNLRGELVHSYSPNVLLKRKLFQTDFEDVIPRLLGKTLLSLADKSIVIRITISRKPATDCMSDCELVVTASQLLEHVISKYFHIDAKEMTLGERINALQTQQRVRKNVLRSLRSLNKMRTELVHDYGTDKLDNRAEFLRLFNQTIGQLELDLDKSELKVVECISSGSRPPPQLYGDYKKSTSSNQFTSKRDRARLNQQATLPTGRAKRARRARRRTER